MFNEIRNFHKFTLKLTPVSAFVIRTGLVDPTPVAADMAFIRTETPYGKTIFIPGSSIKGAFRSHAESLLKSLGKKVCSMSVNGQFDCGKDKGFNGKQNIPSEEVYNEVCFGCKTFGNMKMGSIVKFEDFFPYDADDVDETKINRVKDINKYLTVRNGIKIDRVSGSVKDKALFDGEAVTGGNFYGSLLLKNPELWQVGLINKTIFDIDNGFLKLGGMKSRGFGRVNLGISKLEVFSVSKKVIFTDFDNKTKTFKKIEVDIPDNMADTVIDEMFGTRYIFNTEESIKKYNEYIFEKIAYYGW